MKKLVTSMRIAGILLIAIGLLNAAANLWSVLLAITGIMFILLPTPYSKKEFDKFTGSFSQWKKILLTALFDGILILLIFLVGWLYGAALTSTTDAIKSNGGITREMMVSPTLTAQAAQSLQNLIFTFAAGFLLFLIGGLCIYTIFRYLSWATIAGEQFSKKTLFRFLGLNAIWWLFWLIIFSVVGASVLRDPSSRVVLVILLFIAGYFTLIVHALFTKSNLIGYSISNGLGFGIGKIHRLLVPAALSLVIYYIVGFGIFYLLSFVPFSGIAESARVVLLILYLAWLRAYAYPIIADLPRHEV
ncbi:MAG TPA: hypothetical protein VJJ82_00145 [Candidatus Nanoarchaeia archaeon]|nr:hypothetical protein [Candidatus Nanoarchaeia archaeon]